VLDATGQRVRIWEALMFSFRRLVKETITQLQEPLYLSIDTHTERLPDLEEASPATIP
jgi:hypothetical protein